METIDVDMFEQPAPAPRYASVAELTTAVGEALEEDYELPNGLVVRIRPLMRLEVMRSANTEAPTDHKEQRLLALAMVEPRMSEADVRKWQANSPAGMLQELVQRVQEISGMSKKGAKAAAKDFPGQRE